MYVCVNYYAIWLILSSTYHFLTDDSLQTKISKKTVLWQRNRTYDAVVKFDAHQNLQRHRVVPSAIARLSCMCPCSFLIETAVLTVKRIRRQKLIDRVSFRLLTAVQTAEWRELGQTYEVRDVIAGLEWWHDVIPASARWRFSFDEMDSGSHRLRVTADRHQVRHGHGLGQPVGWVRSKK